MTKNDRAISFVLGVSTPTGIGVIRSLGRVGLPIVSVDHNKNAPGFWSRYASQMLTSDPTKDPKGVLERLQSVGEEMEEKGVLFPTSDAFVLFTSRYRNELSKHFVFCTPSERILEGMINKRRQYEEAIRVGTPISSTYYPTTMEEVRDIENELNYPAFIKPYYSHLWYDTFGNKGFKVFDPKDLRVRYRAIFDSGLEALVQTIIRGPNTNHVKVCAYYGTDGEVHAMFLTRKIRQFPTEFGVGTIMHSIHDDDVQQLGIDFFEGIDYRGVGSIEFKLDDNDGKYKMIELNARLWAQNSQATYAGVNFPLIEYLDLIGEPINEPPRWKDEVRWIDTFEDTQ